jgi:hypothetical protein
VVEVGTVGAGAVVVLLGAEGCVDYDGLNYAHGEE